MSAVLDKSGAGVSHARRRRVLSALTLTANVCSAVVLTAVMIVLIVAPRDSAFLEKPLLGLLCTLLCLAMGWWFVWWCGRREGPSPRVWTLFAVAFTAVSCVITYYSEFSSNWDPEVVRSGALDVVHIGELQPRRMTYFAGYPNNLVLLVIATQMTRFAQMTSLSFFDTVIIMNGMFLFGTLVLASASVATVRRERMIIPVQLLLTLFVGLHPYMTVFYSDLPGAFLCALLLYLGVQMWVSSRPSYLMVGVFAITAGVAYSIKPYVLVVPIATIIFWILSKASGRSRRRGVAGTVGRVLLVLLIFLAANHVEGAIAYRNAQTSATELRQSEMPLPVLHWIAMGFHDNEDASPKTTYGSFDHGIYRRNAAITDPRVRDKVIREGIESDLRRQGMGGTVIFLGKKVAWVLGDGNFFGQKEGEDAVAHPLRPGVISDVTLMGGRWYGFKAKFTQGVWGAVLMALIVGLVRRRRDTGLACLSLAFMGFVGYEAIFEARPRYVIAVLPVILLMLALTQQEGESVWGPTSQERSTEGLCRS